MPSSPPFSIPNIGTANLTAIIATSSLYIYLIALHQHQQKTLSQDQEAGEREHARRNQERGSGPQVLRTQAQQARLNGEDRHRDTYIAGQDQDQDPNQNHTQGLRRYPQDPPRYQTTADPNTYRTTKSKMSKTFSLSEVAAHKDAEKGMYIVVDENVYDVTNFLEEHPGGAKILKRVAGKDASKQFWKYHNEAVLKKYGEKLKIGSVGEKAKL
ncbi:hypothetical protein DSL72_006566 [Monilinia vaccinii-corymbosi]|uniref:Cytochrome b5 heme-binding domain-containing protein n=1 Tax=Monilinia vaccinii-corymbosi TaxID=61207 RepID=A0A8A3PP38_9HELO|nr:hypothetical protein DSL72_006566 [Monilinia vaccinii-corymbosi]